MAESELPPNLCRPPPHWAIFSTVACVFIAIVLTALGWGLPGVGVIVGNAVTLFAFAVLGRPRLER